MTSFRTFEGTSLGITRKEAEARFRDLKPSLRNAILDLQEISDEPPFHFFDVLMVHTGPERRK
jgi:hypothetical protein